MNNPNPVPVQPSEIMYCVGDLQFRYVLAPQAAGVTENPLPGAANLQPAEVSDSEAADLRSSSPVYFPREDDGHDAIGNAGVTVQPGLRTRCSVSPSASSSSIIDNLPRLSFKRLIPCARLESSPELGETWLRSGSTISTNEEEGSDEGVVFLNHVVARPGEHIDNIKGRIDNLGERINNVTERTDNLDEQINNLIEQINVVSARIHILEDRDRSIQSSVDVYRNGNDSLLHKMNRVIEKTERLTELLQEGRVEYHKQDNSQRRLRWDSSRKRKRSHRAQRSLSIGNNIEGIQSPPPSYSPISRKKKRIS
ncbi:hypothetical protein CC78DRAFT_571418 [Lojkania enalia]|uniref:Uncharacterized protein n=1 Tax=Lojkania enalia TaxID=147567 RepID=A0A9P4MZA3_9PLEO|nr:hypothetical protein CC78DRAFT_571418 [Didymosphaeria enalia]